MFKKQENTIPKEGSRLLEISDRNYLKPCQLIKQGIDFKTTYLCIDQKGNTLYSTFSVIILQILFASDFNLKLFFLSS